MNSVQEKWKANSDKVAYAKSFPGLLNSWKEAEGKGVQSVFSLPDTPGVLVVLFDDSTFIVSGISSVDPAPLLSAIAALRDEIGEQYEDAYRELDELTEHDRELTRQARLENILGAIRNNIRMLPELHERVPELMKKLSEPLPQPGAQQTDSTDSSDTSRQQ